ncbi:hypothetical protein [Streptomyces sp. V4I2]|uniref:hypothetical protein n=1 Tax=Streptomyces sp. V4I2 TaxID=3042280 RepID=UPI002785232F|nr:hypothetical protein [Streptomyces sp. V4I2]MDQ1041816.1 hypothetical protein [Streptomyces sp. V4I2]
MDNDLTLRLFRPYLALKRGVTADEEDLDRRFDAIMDNVARKQASPRTAAPRPSRCICRAASHVGRRIAAHLAKGTVAGAGVAVAGYTARMVADVASLAVITVTAVVTVFAVTAVGDHYEMRHKRTADTEHDVVTSTTFE